MMPLPRYAIKDEFGNWLYQTEPMDRLPGPKLGRFTEEVRGIFDWPTRQQAEEFLAQLRNGQGCTVDLRPPFTHKHSREVSK